MINYILFDTKSTFDVNTKDLIVCFYFCFGCNIDIINLDITKEKGKHLCLGVKNLRL